MSNKRIYLATSWRNAYYTSYLALLRSWDYEVYDFRDPEYAFKWHQVGGPFADPKDWTPQHYRDYVINTREAQRGFDRDMGALMECDICVMLQPCGASAHSEVAWACGAGKKTIIVLKPDRFEPELMYKMFDHIVVNDQELKAALDQIG